MNIIRISEDHLDICTEIARKEYLKECESVAELFEEVYKEELFERLKLPCIQGNGIICVNENHVYGYLIYDRKIEVDKLNYITVPVWGYGIEHNDRTKVMAFLFQYFAEEVMKLYNNVQFHVKIYAHDREILSFFTFCQFGILCTDTIRSTSERIHSNSEVNCRELSKVEIINRKPEILRLYRFLVEHLQRSPVFYPGTEFTDELYMAYILNTTTRMFAAFDRTKIIGIIDASVDKGCFLLNRDEIYNVGDIYVEEAYRGKRVSQTLLEFVNNTLKYEGVKKIWVEHGTANPNATGFWDKYLKNFTYTLVRNIKLLS